MAEQVDSRPYMHATLQPGDGSGVSHRVGTSTSETDLVADVITFQVDRVIAEMQPALEAMTTAADVLAWCEKLIADHTHPWGGHPLADRLAGVRTRRYRSGPRAALQRGFARWEALLTGGLRRVADRGDLHPGAEPAVLAAGLLAAYQGGMLLANVNGGVEPMRRAFQVVTSTALTPTVTARRPARRGKGAKINDVCIVVCDGLKGLPEAITTVWDRAIVQTCVIHLLRNTFRYASRKYWDQIAKEIRPV